MLTFAFITNDSDVAAANDDGSGVDGTKIKKNNDFQSYDMTDRQTHISGKY